jgi:hypothetical protein
MTDILIITYEAVSTKQVRNPDKSVMGRQTSGDTRMGPFLSKVSAESLRSSFKELVDALGSTLTMPDAIGSFQVDALDIELELTAEGQIGLLGTGGKLGGKGSLTLKLKRLEQSSAKVEAR